MQNSIDYYTHNFLDHYCKQLIMIGIPEDQLGVFIGALYNSMKLFANENKDSIPQFKSIGRYSKE